MFSLSCVEYHDEAGLLYVGGSGQIEEGGSVASKEGLTAWRRLSDFPHYKMVTDLAEDLCRVGLFPAFQEALGCNQDQHSPTILNPLPDDKIFDWSKLK